MGDVSRLDDALRTGHADIDAQHEWLFALADRVRERIGDCPLDTPSGDAHPVSGTCEAKVDDALEDAVYGLIDYIAEHFEDEERLMRAAGFPFTGTHSALHENLSRKVSGFALRSFNDQEIAAEELVDFFTEWLSGHIMGDDRAFTVWLAEKEDSR